MVRITRVVGVALLLAGFGIASVWAQPPDKKGEEDTEEDKADSKAPEEKISETTHSISIDGKRIEYKVIAGTMALKEDTEDPKATIFFIAYTRTDADDPADRPLTFSFNGGPGSSSVWLHMGLLGPRRVLMDSAGFTPPPPYQLVDNEYSLLDVTDLVFIDPVSTGFSRPVEGEEAGQFHGVKQDIRAVGEFIRLYTTKYERWASPKFLIGESYGTTRAAGLAGYLQDDRGMFLNGIMLVSVVLNFQTIRFATGNDLPFALYLPTYAATAWYHDQLDTEPKPGLRQHLNDAESFALGEYTTALMLGDGLPPHAREAVTQELSRLTGLSEDYVEQTNQRIHIWRFCKELRRDERRTVGRLDSRFVGIDADAAGEGMDYDPSYANILGAYSGMFNDYVRRELEFESDLPYEILTGKVHPWKYDSWKNRYVNVAETLREAMTKNPSLKVFVASGYYDLATPYLATDYTFSHLGLDPSLQDNVTIEYYEAGHMMYIHIPSLAKMRTDLVNFLESAK